MPLPDLIGSRARAHPLWLAPLLGALAACGFQPLMLWPATIAAVAALIALVEHAPGARRAALLGWLFGVGHFTVGDFWIATAFTYQANMPAWLGVVAVVLLALYLAVYPALATLAAWLLARRCGGGRGVGVLLAPCWIVAEWLRGWVFTGFAWNPLGVALLGGDATPGLALFAPYIGTYGLSGLLVGLAALARAAPRLPLVPGYERARFARWIVPGVILAIVVIVMTVRVREDRRDPAGPVLFTLVQPDVRQPALDDPRQYEASFQRTATLSLSSRPDLARLVLWPESGVPDYLRDGYPRGYYAETTYAGDPALARARIGRVIGGRAVLLTGAVDLVIARGEAVAARNAVTALDGAGRIVGAYDKAHLVPYGEYLALRWLLAPLGATRLVPGAIDFLPGPGPRTLDLGALGRAGVQICYEITFSGRVVDRAHRPDYLFNPSNDGWFGAWGPPQHLAQARLRAIEEGLPVLRATTTGISAVIDASGVVRAWIAPHVAARIDGLVPRARPPTLFARLGNALPLSLAAIWLAASLVALRRARR